LQSRHTSSPFCSGYFGDRDFENYLPGLASNHDLPNISLPSSWDYRRESRHPAEKVLPGCQSALMKVEVLLDSEPQWQPSLDITE
jgi:hypothetical protein